MCLSIKYTDLGYIFHLQSPSLFSHLIEDCGGSIFKLLGGRNGFVFCLSLVTLVPGDWLWCKLEVSEGDFLVAKYWWPQTLSFVFINQSCCYWTMFFPQSIPVFSATFRFWWVLKRFLSFNFSKLYSFMVLLLALKYFPFLLNINITSGLDNFLLKLFLCIIDRCRRCFLRRFLTQSCFPGKFYLQNAQGGRLVKVFCNIGQNTTISFLALNSSITLLNCIFAFSKMFLEVLPPWICCLLGFRNIPKILFKY